MRLKETIKFYLLNTCTLIAVVAMTLYFFSQVSDYAFGISSSNHPIIINLALSLDQPFRFFGLTLLASSLVHESSTHLLTNCLLLFWLGAILHTKFSNTRILVLYCILALVNNLAVVVASHALNQSGFVLGASACLISLSTLAILLQISGSKGLIIPLLLVVWLQPESASSLTTAGHLSGTLTGIIAYLLLKKRMMLLG
ncbi:MAG: hypothetical protein COT74_10830 [Bdellovibrionales bacterium CG10_big_fil_rev_8_21_14_0_10_45_34]|nr:MAG: hypothetical protein COT74_10830 [Bdellovibrionales bacterium CG10_big_fil_rev_8_21_14_0_10_45_34]